MTGPAEQADGSLPAPSRVVVVTGAAAGIGRATALRLLDDGHRVGALDVDGDGLASLAGEVDDPERLVTRRGDVADAAAVLAAVAGVRHALGPV